MCSLLCTADKKKKKFPFSLFVSTLLLFNFWFFLGGGGGEEWDILVKTTETR